MKKLNPNSWSWSAQSFATAAAIAVVLAIVIAAGSFIEKADDIVVGTVDDAKEIQDEKVEGEDDEAATKVTLLPETPDKPPEFISQERAHIIHRRLHEFQKEVAELKVELAGVKEALIREKAKIAGRGSSLWILGFCSVVISLVIYWIIISITSRRYDRLYNVANELRGLCGRSSVVIEHAFTRLSPSAQQDVVTPPRRELQRQLREASDLS